MSLQPVVVVESNPTIREEWARLARKTALYLPSLFISAWVVMLVLGAVGLPQFGYWQSVLIYIGVRTLFGQGPADRTWMYTYREISRRLDS